MAETTITENQLREAAPDARRDSVPVSGRGFLRRFGREWTAMFGAAILVVFAVLAIFAPVVAPHDPNATNAMNILSDASRQHLLGTDNLGRDILSRLIFGARWSLGAAALATTMIVIIGVTVGLISGFFGGWIDDVLMRVVDVLLAFPSLVLALAIVGMLGPSLRNVLIGVVAVWWVDYARVVRGLTLSIREREFITAARCVGCHPWRMIVRHVLPNAIPSVIVLATLEIGVMMLAISGLSFLGLGAQPPTPEWGAMLNAGRPAFQSAPQLMIYPGICITLAVIGFNLVGDSLRDILDPHMKR
jgi:peptide/nickel transport system permease protein